MRKSIYCRETPTVPWTVCGQRRRLNLDSKSKFIKGQLPWYWSSTVCIGSVFTLWWYKSAERKTNFWMAVWFGPIYFHGFPSLVSLCPEFMRKVGGSIVDSIVIYLMIITVAWEIQYSSSGAVMRYGFSLERKYEMYVTSISLLYVVQF